MNDLERDAALVKALVSFSRLTPYALAKRIGVAVSTINRHHNGTAETRLGRSTIKKLRNAFPDFPGWSDDDSVASGVKDRRLTYSGPPSELVYVAEIDLRFGLGAAFMDQEVVEQEAELLPFPRAWIRKITTSPTEQLYWARARGDSMEPDIGDGDVVLIDRSQTDGLGDLYWAIAYGQNGMIKRLRPMPDGSVKILSNNQSVAPEIAYDGELNIFGRVVAVVKRI